MILFEQYFKLYEEAGPNKHLTHLEELVLTDKRDGALRAINYLNALSEVLDSNTTKPINSTVKFDGCIHPDTLLITTEGYLTIGDIIKSNNNIKVKAHDFETNTDVWVHAEKPRINDNNKDWVEIVLENDEILRCTVDHKIYTTNRGWVEAQDLTEDDDLKFI